MRKKLLLLLLICLPLVILSSCFEDVVWVNYTVEVYDIDGELLESKNLSKNNSTTLFEDLKNEFDVQYSESEYGPYLIKIGKQIVDPNYYCSIYVNGDYAQTGIGEIEKEDGKTYTFKMECWNTVESGYGTMDKYDVLVDKIIYSFAKTYLKDMLSADKSYTGSNYWTYMAIYMMQQNGYDKSVFNLNSVSAELVESIDKVDVNTLKGANIGKYFYVARALGKDLTAFTNAYQTYLNEAIPEKYSEYSHPFIMSPAASLNLTSSRLEALINTEYIAGTAWGYDGLNWQIASLTLFKKYEKDILDTLILKDQGNGVSNALCLLSYAALNENIRDEVDMIKILIDNYYNEELNLVCWSMKDKGLTTSSCQIYASLLAYKASRDLGKGVNIFA